MIPETFKPAAEARTQGLTQRRPGGVSLQPDDNIDGRFAASERLPDGFYTYVNDSMGTLPDFGPRNPNAPHIPLHPRASFDSMASGSAGNSVYMPRRVESIMGDEDRRKYLVAQANQLPAGGAYMEEPRENYNHVYAYKNGMESSDSVNSANSYFATNATKQEGHYLQNYSVDKEASSAGSSPGTTPEAPSGDTSPEGDISRLQLPEAAHTSPRRSGNAGRSPLAMHSLVRMDTAEEANNSFQGHGESTPEENDEGNDEQDTKSEKKRRNKLTKHKG